LCYQSKMPGRYFEDIEVGSRQCSASIQLTEQDILDFARIYDPQPMHVDPEAARKGPFGGLIASGWHTAALVMKLIAEARPFGDAEVLGLGVDELRWPAPVRPGDTIQCEMEIISMRTSQSKPDYGIVKVKVTTRNQNGQPVMIHSPACWVPRRPSNAA
jgi:acyl dehydratase